MDDQATLVYRLCYSTAGHDISPGHLWGTIEAIAAMGNCVPVYASERQVSRATLDPTGFLFEHSYAGIAEIAPPKPINCRLEEALT